MESNKENGNQNPTLAAHIYLFIAFLIHPTTNVNHIKRERKYFEIA